MVVTIMLILSILTCTEALKGPMLHDSYVAIDSLGNAVASDSLANEEGSRAEAEEARFGSSSAEHVPSGGRLSAVAR